MLLEEDTEVLLERSKYSLLRTLYDILLFLSLPILFPMFYAYYYHLSNVSLPTTLFSLIIFVIICYVRLWLLERNLNNSSYITGFLFLLLGIYSAIFLGSLNPIPILLVLISFCITLILVGDRLAFCYVIAYLFSSILIDISRVVDSTVFLNCIVFWLLSLLIFILYRACEMMKICNRISIESSRKYNHLKDLEYKDLLMGKISKSLLHDISTPLSVISGSMKLMENKEMSKEESLNVRGVTMDSLLYLENILKDSLDLVRETSLEEEFDPNVSILHILNMLDGRIKSAGILLKINLCNECFICGNQCMFSRIFLNILINSIEELESIMDCSKSIWVESCVDREEYTLIIRDNGRGIAENVLHTLNDSHSSSKESEHLGLGLSFVYDSIKNDFQGTVDIETKEGEYTAVVLTLPLRRAS